MNLTLWREKNWYPDGRRSIFHSGVPEVGICVFCPTAGTLQIRATAKTVIAIERVTRRNLGERCRACNAQQVNSRSADNSMSKTGLSGHLTEPASRIWY